MPFELFYLNSLDRFTSYIGGVWLVFIITVFERISELNANSADPDQTPRSDLGLQCLRVSLLWDARHKWVKTDLCSKTLNRSNKRIVNSENLFNNVGLLHTPGFTIY